MNNSNITENQKSILRQIEDARNTLNSFEQWIKSGKTNIMQERVISALLTKFNSQK